MIDLTHCVRGSFVRSFIRCTALPVYVRSSGRAGAARSDVISREPHSVMVISPVKLNL